jgi:acyl-CoA synthetase (AMP-forming)/AMP-acid ligase II
LTPFRVAGKEKSTVSVSSNLPSQNVRNWMNIVDPILFQSALQPKSAAMCAPGTGIGLISYGRLAQMIHTICRQLTRFGLAPHKMVAVQIKDPIFLAAVTLALARLGVVSVSRYDDRTLDTIKVDTLISDAPLPQSKVDQVILVDLSWIKANDVSLESFEPARTSPDDLCRIILTSGTTGNPKGVAFTHRMVANRTASNSFVFGSRFPACSRIYSDLPISTAPGFWFFIHTLWRGGTFFLPGETFEMTIDAFDEYKVQCVVASPAGLEVLLRNYEQYPSLQSELEMMIAIGDVLTGTLSDRVRRRICSHVTCVYGATETQTTATAPAQLLRDTPGAVGFVVPNVTIEIVSESGEVLPRGVEGLVRIKGPNVVDRYFGEPEASAKAFRDGWYYPGDRGRLESGNLLCLAGRQDTLLNLGGDKINPEAIERALASCPGITECAAFSAPNDFGIGTLWVAVVADPSNDDDRLRDHCAAHLPKQFVPAGFIRVESLPRNTMGKIDRPALPMLLK